VRWAQPVACARFTNTGGFFDETTLVIFDDAIVNFDTGAVLVEHPRKQALARVVTLDVPRDQVQSCGVVLADEMGQVRSFQEKPRPQQTLSTAARQWHFQLRASSAWQGGFKSTV